MRHDAYLRLVLAALLSSLVPAGVAQEKSSHKSQEKLKLPRPQRLDRGLEFHRDSATGELRVIRSRNEGAKILVQGGKAQAGASASLKGTPAAPAGPPANIRARVSLVEVSCRALSADGTPLRGLGREDFRVFEDGIEQPIAHFDASSDPASVALVLDASPSVFRELAGMKAAARTLAKYLSPRDEIAVVAFAAQAQLVLPFTRDRALLESAMTSPALAQVADSTQSNIYQAVYLTARELFQDRAGRKAIVLLTDGQDSGLGLSWDPASATLPPAGVRQNSSAKADRLTFEDLARELAAAGVEVYAISTQPRPRAMTQAWLATHRDEMLVTPAARELGIPHYTLYLAELVRRAGGQIFFFREIGTLGDIYRQITETLIAQYTLGYYPAAGLAKPGWRSLRVELRGDYSAPYAASAVTGRDEPGATRDAVGAPRGQSEGGVASVRVIHRIAYYVPAAP